MLLYSFRNFRIFAIVIKISKSVAREQQPLNNTLLKAPHFSYYKKEIVVMMCTLKMGHDKKEKQLESSNCFL